MDQLPESERFSLYRTGGDLNPYLRKLVYWMEKLYGEIAGRVNWLLGKAYGGISAVGNATATAIAVAGTAVQITIFGTNSYSNNCTSDHTNDHITIERPGDYLINLTASVELVAAASSTFELFVKKNNGATNVGALRGEFRLITGGVTTGQVHISGIARLSKDDTIEAWIANLNGTDNYVVHHANLNILQVGST